MTYRSVTSERSLFSRVHIKLDRWLLLLIWASYSCSKLQSSCENFSETVKGTWHYLQRQHNPPDRFIHGNHEKKKKYSKGVENVVAECFNQLGLLYQAVWIITVGHRPFSVQNVAMAVHFSLLPDKTAAQLQFAAYINFRSSRILFIHRSFTLLLQ